MLMTNDLKHCTKDKYVKLVSETGIEVDPTWKVDKVCQLYLANTNTAVERTIPNNGDPINVDTNQATDSATVQPLNSRPPVNTATRTEEILKETTSALKTATETLTTMTSFVGSVMQQRNNVTQSSNPTGVSISASNERSSYNLAFAMLATYNYRQETPAIVEQTFHRHLDKTGVIYAEDLPKMDYVSPTIRKQILEGKDVNLACLLVVELSSRDVRLDHHLTLDEFNKAFRKYRNVLCKPYPQRKNEMEQYEADKQNCT
jgi:hypothetical protein